MRLFSGLERTDYQDVLRAIGALIDRRHVADFRLLELEDGLLLQTWHFVLQPVKVELQRFTDAQLRAVLEAAYQRRGSGGPRRAGRFEERRYGRRDAEGCERDSMGHLSRELKRWRSALYATLLKNHLGVARVAVRFERISCSWTVLLFVPKMGEPQ